LILEKAFLYRIHWHFQVIDRRKRCWERFLWRLRKETSMNEKMFDNWILPGFDGEFCGWFLFGAGDVVAFSDLGCLAKAWETETLSPAICVWAFNAAAQSASVSNVTKANLGERIRKKYERIEVLLFSFLIWTKFSFFQFDMFRFRIKRFKIIHSHSRFQRIDVKLRFINCFVGWWCWLFSWLSC